MDTIRISLAGDLGSGKTTVGRLLAEKIGGELYSTGTIQRRVAEEMGMTTLELNRYMETHPEIDRKIDDGLRMLERENRNLVIDSRLAWNFVPSSFSVYMHADPVVAAERILSAGRSTEPFATAEEAAESIAARRRSEILRYRTLYGLDIADMSNYRYVIDTTRVSPETVAERIYVRCMQFRRGEAIPHEELFPGK